jgi:FlaA1/EpsC-like NDP-sugar epimerase
MVRYFMTIPEASQLVIQAGTMGKGGEIFILDMGEPVNILELAKETVRLSGLKPFEDIDIVFTGIRPGEKLYEELEISEERMTKTIHPKIYIGRIAAYPAEEVQSAIGELRTLADSGDEAMIRTYLNTLIPEAKIAEQAAGSKQ